MRLDFLSVFTLIFTGFEGLGLFTVVVAPGRGFDEGAFAPGRGLVGGGPANAVPNARNNTAENAMSFFIVQLCLCTAFLQTGCQIAVLTFLASMWRDVVRKWYAKRCNLKISNWCPVNNGTARHNSRVLSCADGA